MSDCRNPHLSAYDRASIEDAERSTKTAQTARECADDEIIYGFEFCGKPDSTMLGETMFDYNGEPIGWIVANGPKGDCGWGSTFCPQCGGDLLTDEEPRKFGVTVEQMAKASTDFFDNLPSVNGKNGDFLPTTAEDEDANCKKADSLQDSREKLEADVRVWKDSVCSFSDDELYAKVAEWLDRQAAITRAECDKPNWDYCETCDQFKAMQDRIDELEAALKGERNNFYQATEARKHWQRKYESVKAERDELQERVDNLCASEEIGNKLIMAQLETEAERGRTIVEYAERVGELEAERASWTSCYHIDRLAKLQAQRDRYRDLLSKAVDEAQSIVKLMEVES